MRSERSTDPAARLLGELAEEIADRLASRLAPRLSELVEGRNSELTAPGGTTAHHGGRKPPTAYVDEVPDDGMWTAGQVAAHYHVAVRFVYQHADELGCVRLGGGLRPRLRFDPTTVHERWPQVGAALPEVAPARRRTHPPSGARRRRDSSDVDLLDFERER